MPKKKKKFAGRRITGYYRCGSPDGILTQYLSTYAALRFITGEVKFVYLHRIGSLHVEKPAPLAIPFQ
jgi:hypothetical protein